MQFINISSVFYRHLIVLLAIASGTSLKAIPNVDLGELFVPPAGISGTPTIDDQDFPASEAFNGVSDSSSDAWLANAANPANLRWNIDPSLSLVLMKLKPSG